MMTGLPPRIPACSVRRYEWLSADDPDLMRLRAGVQEGGPGMYLVWCPIRSRKVLIEAYEPWELRHPDYRVPRTIQIPTRRGRDEKVTLSRKLTPFQYEDFRRGEMVCTAELAVLEGVNGWVVPGRDQPLPGGVAPPAPLDNRLLTVLRRNNRAARAEFQRKRFIPKRQFEITLRNRMADEEAAKEKVIDDLATEFGEETAKVLTPKVTVL